MSTDKIEIARTLGKQVALGEALYCPICSDNPPVGREGKQLMSSFGDIEERLFCPHCDLGITLTVTHRGVDMNTQTLKLDEINEPYDEETINALSGVKPTIEQEPGIGSGGVALQPNKISLAASLEDANHRITELASILAELRKEYSAFANDTVNIIGKLRKFVGMPQ